MKPTKTIATIFCAYFFSLLGDSLFKIAFPLFIYAKSESSLYTSLSYATQHAPYIFIMPFMGGIVDRLSKKKLLLSTDVLSTLLMFALTFYCVLVLVWNVPVLPMFFLFFLVMSVDTVNHPAFHAFVPHIVSSEQFPKINSGMGVMSNVLSVLGALLGGALVMHVGAISVFGMNAFSFVLSFLFISLLPKDAAQPCHHQRMSGMSVLFADLRKSVRYTFRNAIGRFFAIFHFFYNFGISLILGGMIYYLADIMRLSSAQVGLVMGLAGIGSVVGSFITPMLMKKIPHGNLYIIVSFFGSLALLSFVWAHSVAYTLFCLFLTNMITGIIIVLTFTIRQQRIPKEHLGKTIVITRPLAFASVPISSIIAGFVLGEYGNIVPLSLVGFSVLFIASLVAMKTQFVRIVNTKLHGNECIIE